MKASSFKKLARELEILSSSLLVFVTTFKESKRGYRTKWRFAHKLAVLNFRVQFNIEHSQLNSISVPIQFQFNSIQFRLLLSPSIEYLTFACTWPVSVCLWVCLSVSVCLCVLGIRLNPNEWRSCIEELRCDWYLRPITVSMTRLSYVYASSSSSFPSSSSSSSHRI